MRCMFIEEMPDTVFVSGLPDDVEEGQLADFFGAIGIIKVCFLAYVITVLDKLMIA